MEARDLVEMLRCPKRHMLEQLSLSDGGRLRAYSGALRLLAQYLAESDQDAEGVMRDYLVETYQAEWFDLIWQKDEAIREDVRQLIRMKRWICANFKGKIVSRKNYDIAFSGNCGGKTFDKLSITADAVVEGHDGSVHGMIFCRQFSRPYSFHARKPEHKVCYAVELLCLLEALCQQYPGRQIRVYLLRGISKKDRPGSLAIFDEKRGDNVLSLNQEELNKVTGGGFREAMHHMLKGEHTESCLNCHYEELCKPAAQVYLKHPKTKGEAANAPIQYTLNQQRVIQRTGGPMRIMAGPGSGKTATLVARIQCLIDSRIDPRVILAVTYTRLATQEIMGRIQSDRKPQICTLHSLGFQIIRQHEHILGRKKLVGRVDCMQLLLHTLNYAPKIQNVSYEGLVCQHGLLSRLLKDFAFINEFGEAAFAKAHPGKDARNIFIAKTLYERQFKDGGYILFEDQIALAARLLESHPAIRKKYQDKYQYILVDEAQDLDDQQVRLLKLLVKAPQNNIAVCGDVDQSIYGFRGGSSKFMMDFTETYPESADIRLDDNFRSSRNILEAANELINHNVCRIPIRMKASFKNDIRVAKLENFHINRIGLLIQDMLKLGYRQNEIAVIARANKELSCACDMLDQYNRQENQGDGEYLKYDRPKRYIYQDFTFQTYLDLLNLYLNNMDSDKCLYRILTSHGITPEKRDKGLNLYDNYLHEGIIFPMQGEEETRYLTVTKEEPAIRQVFAKMYRAFKLFSLPIETAVEEIRAQFFDERLDNQEAMEYIQALIYEKGIRNPEELYRCMNAARRFEDDAKITYSAGGGEQIHLLTAHGAKGKEFPVVFIYGVDAFERNDLQEDRRLLYVALTRAKEIAMVSEIHRGESGFLREMWKYLEIKEGGRYA